MKIGLIGLRNSGKTTIFNALTKSQVQVTPYAGSKTEPNVAVVDVIDERVNRLSEIYRPRKTVYATVEFIDFFGLAEGSAREGLFASATMGSIRNVDALALVLRNFEDPASGAPSPLQDMRQVDEELLLSDLMIVESRLERIEWRYKRGQKTEDLKREEGVFQRILDCLNQARPVRELALNREEEKIIRGFQFLTQKPCMVILNSGEEGFGRNPGILEEIEKDHRAVEFAGQFEMELSLLNDEDARLFMEDLGIRESARDRLTRLSYETLGYVSFFTVGSDEVRAWNICAGDTALDAAASIHTDLARGFIRAECFSYDDLVAYGSERGIRENGRFHLEGRGYVIQDGNILNIRFNV